MHVKEVTTNLWSVVLPGETTDEWDKLMEQWHNPYYLHNFFSERVSYLRYFKLDVEQAIRAVIDECYQIEDIILEGRFAQDFFFQPLDKEQKEIIEFQLNKGKLAHLDRPSLLRLYAIKLPEDVYILTGGAIKLTRKMQEAENTNSELIKMKKCRDIFRQNNIL
ncbi:MAG: hypothetical protein LUF87_03270 [Alistipes sp.]|nr:hypothetical protein [Alistipes sp.]